MFSKLLIAVMCSMMAVATSSWAAVSTVPTTNAYGIKIFGNLMFVADASSGFRIVDISNPASMTILSTLPIPGSNGRDIILGPNPSQFVYYVGWFQGFYKIDVSNPMAPTIDTHLPTPGVAYQGDISGGYAYIADQYEGLQIVSLATMTIVKNVPMADISRAVVVHGNYAYVSNQGSGVNIIDISNIATASVVATYNPGGVVKFCAVSPAGTLFVLTNPVVYVADISSTPTAPVFIKQFGGFVVSTRMTIDGTHGYIADWQGGMQVVEDITDPVNVQITQNLQSTWLVGEVQFANGHAFLADGWGGVVSAVETPPTPLAPVVMSMGATWPSSPFNGQLRIGGSSFDLVRFPSFLDGATDVTVHMASSYPIPDNTEISLSCNNPTGCDYFISLFTCPACSSANGGLPAALLANDWVAGSCAPAFETMGSSTAYPMTTFFRHIPEGTTTFTTTAPTDYLAIFASSDVVANAGTWCYKQHGPAVSGAGCAANCPPSL